MAKQSVATELAKRIRELRAERQSHQSALEEIDQMFAELGINPKGEAAPRRGRPPKKGKGRPVGRPAGRPAAAGTRRKKSAKRGRRGSYKQTAEQFVLDLLGNGRKLTTAEINQKWKSAGRGGTANNTLSKLTKAGSVHKANIEGGRGSQYSAA